MSLTAGKNKREVMGYRGGVSLLGASFQVKNQSVVFSSVSYN